MSKLAQSALAFAILFIPNFSHAWTSNGCTNHWCSIDVDRTNDFLMIRDYNGSIIDNRIWIENDTGGAIELRLEDTNPAYYAFVTNNLKDGMITSGPTYLRVWYVDNYVGASGQTYNKIAQVGIR